jgi:putative hydrolase of the HAD superfamily
MGKRVVLFDLDNTLVMEDEATFRALRDACDLAAVRAGVDAEALFTVAVSSADELFRAAPTFPYADRMGIWWGEALWGEFAGDEPDLRALRELLPDYRRRVWRGALAAVGVTDDALVGALIDDYIKARRAGQIVDPEADAVLADLSRDHTLALVTNGAPDVQREKLAGTPFASRFATIVISAEVGVGKPDPRIFEIALERLGVSAADAAMVGDSLERDVRGAKAAGIRAIWIDRGLWPAPDDPQVPDARITRLGALRARLSAPAPGGASPRGSP